MAEKQLPPGWECKFDQKTGKLYYINHFTRTTTFDDPTKPRTVARPNPSYISNTEAIPMQPMHGSPYHVYPAQHYPAAQVAFQGPAASGALSVSASPLLATKLQQQMQEMSPLSRPSPHTPRAMSHLARQSIQETSFISNTEIDTAVAKINTMFPTVTDTHIRLLLKKYYNREAVVISALQVEKHPLTTPGPYSTPPPPRHFHATAMGVSSIFQMTPPLGRCGAGSGGVGCGDSTRTASPVPRPASGGSGSLYGSPRVGETYRSSPRPHSSPKMKLRYLKSIFPKADETLLLDILASSENNVQKASEKLIGLGYEKRDTTAPRLSNRKKEQELFEKNEAERVAAQPPRARTTEERNQMKARIQAKYRIGERIISMALESVDYAEDKACQILDIVMHEDDSKTNTKSDAKDEANDKQDSSTDIQTQTVAVQVSATAPSQAIVQLGDADDQFERSDAAPIDADTIVKTSAKLSKDGKVRPRQSRCKSKGHSKCSISRSSPDDTNDGSNKLIFKSVMRRTAVSGPNLSHQKGPNDELLLADYITWNGANPDFISGRKNLVTGSDPALRSHERSYVARGSNNELCKGPQRGLAKGSIYSQLIRPLANVRCN